MKSSVNHRMIIETKGDEIEFARKFWAEIKRLALSESAPERKTEILNIHIRCQTKDCQYPAKEKRGVTNGIPWHGIFCDSGEKSHTKWITDKK